MKNITISRRPYRQDDTVQLNDRPYVFFITKIITHFYTTITVYNPVVVFSVRHAFLRDRHTAHLCDLEMDETRSGDARDVFDRIDNITSIRNIERPAQGNSGSHTGVITY